MTIEVTPDRSSWRSQQIDIGGILRRWWNEAEDYQKLGYCLALALFVGGLLHGLIWLFEGGSLSDNISWRKPTLFLTACGVTAGTFIWALRYFKIDRTAGWQLAIGVLVPATGVSSMVAFQQWRGARSHFNFFQSPFDAVVAALMVVAIQLLLPTAVIYSRLTFKALRPVGKDLALALQAGILFVNVSFMMGFVTIMNAVTNGLLFTIQTPSVIGQAGTMKLPHGVAMHGLQLFLALVALMYFSDYCEKRKLRVVQVAVAGYGLLVAVSLYQTLGGHAPLDLDWLAGGGIALGISMVVAAVGIALYGFVRARIVGVRSAS